MRRLPLAVALVLALAGCGGDSDDLTVSAAASLKQAFTQYGRQFAGADVRFSFAGSDELAAQIEQGVKPDVYAAANTKLPQQLYEKGLVEQPTVFAGNRLVLAVPADGARVSSLRDLGRDGVKLAIGAEDVPVGAYTRTVLENLPDGERAAILANVRSEEPDVRGVVGKLAQGAADAGFVYLTDVKATGGELEAIELPAGLEPEVAYGAGVVKKARQPELAAKFVDGLTKGACADALTAAGFGAAP